MFHVKHFLAVISLLVMKCKLRYAIESIYYRYQGESLIYISFPIGICFKRVPVHSYPFPYLNPLPSSRARKRAAVRRYADNHLTALFAHSKDSEPAMFHVKHFGIIIFIKRAFIDLTL